MTWQIVISTASLALTAIMALMIYSWKGGEWTGGERRHSEDLERRMDTANAEMSKLTGTIQKCLLTDTELKVLEARFAALERHVEGPDGIAKRVHILSNQWSSIENLKERMGKLESQK